LVRSEFLKAKLVAFCLLAIALTGPGFRSVSKLRAQPRADLKKESSDRLWRVALLDGNNLYAAGRYADAAKTFDEISGRAALSHNLRISASARADVGAVQFTTYQYRAALASFLSARHLAEASGDAATLAMIDANLASLYTEMGDYDEAARWMQGVLGRMNGKEARAHLAQVQIQLGTLRFRQKRRPEALVLFRQGIAAAATAGDWNLYSIGWNRVGEEYMKAGFLDLAEGPLLEAYRVRKLRNLPLDTSYRNLGRLRLEQGDLQGASVLLDRAIELSGRANGPIPAWYAYHYRGCLRLAQGRTRDALADLRVAVRLARAWRWSAPPDDAMRRGAEGWLDMVYSALTDAGNRLYMKTRDPELMRETFEAVEENRANSLRVLVEGRGDAAADLQPAYWDAASILQRAEVTALRSPTPASEEAVRSARANVVQIEASSTSGSPVAAEDLLRSVRASLDRDTAVISFHVGDGVSWMWAVDANGIALYPLPPRGTLKPLITAAAAAIRDGDGASTAGATLYKTLFSSLAPRFQHKSRWLLALDDALFDVPFAALPVPSQGRSAKAQFLVERRITEIIPSVAYWLAWGNSPAPQREAGQSARLFLGIGDPIYNSADARLPKPARGAKRASPLELLAAPLSPLALPLPRLVASAAELEACARAWNGNQVLLEGSNASRIALEEQLRRHPDVLHFATHFVPSGGAEPQTTIALSLTDEGVVDSLRPAEIARWRIGAQLVVLSGCNSAAGAVLPGTGLLGLNRAWLAAGAHSVISSHWAVPDESGSLFASLYRNFSAGGVSAAQALRAAQLEMLRSADWRARPRYWGAYFAMGKE
jgi:CHAT domain-containing protein/tetratricopeptide (TPR) repeat protein